ASESLRFRGNGGVATGVFADETKPGDWARGVVANNAFAKVAREAGARHRRFARSRSARIRFQDDAGPGRGNLGDAAADEFPPGLLRVPGADAGDRRSLRCDGVQWPAPDA